MNEVTPIRTVMENLRPLALHGAKVPHTLSNPVLRRLPDGYAIAQFGAVYTARQRREGAIPRPSFWLLSDVRTGALLREIPCGQLDFSHQPPGSVCRTGLENPPQKADFDALFAQFDLVRQHLADSGILDARAYLQYLDNLLRFVPEDFRIYYRELSSLRGREKEG